MLIVLVTVGSPTKSFTSIVCGTAANVLFRGLRVFDSSSMRYVHDVSQEMKKMVNGNTGLDLEACL